MRILLLIIPFLFLGCKSLYVLDKPAQRLPVPQAFYSPQPGDATSISDVIKDYIISNFDQKKSKRAILLNSKNNHNCCGCEMCKGPAGKSRYSNIIITNTFHCDSPQNIFEFIGYDLNEVLFLLKMLLKDGNYYKWYENSFFMEEFDPDVYSGTVEVLEEEDRVSVLIQFESCQD